MSPALAAADLVAAGRALAVPFHLTVAAEPESGPGPQSLETDSIECLQVLRLLPGRRLVARARVGATQCVAKLFIGKDARRYYERERRGLQRIKDCGVPTPALLGCISLPDGAGFGLLLEWLVDAEPVAERDGEAFMQIVGALARLHNGSATQNDPHLDNYLKTGDGQVFAIDGDGVRRRPVLLRHQALANLGVFLAQFPPAADGHLPAACAEYLRLRWQTPVSDAFVAEMRRHLRRQRLARTRRYLAKTLRECTEFHCERRRAGLVVCARDRWDEAMSAFAEAPEVPFADAEVLKAGNSATVIRTGIGQHSYVIKRYNVKSFTHGLRRALRPVPRYRMSWRNGHRLGFLRMRTARPVALVESRSGPFATTAYLVMDDLGPAAVDLAASVAQRAPTQALVEGVAALFRDLADAELVHGDTKASNFLVRDDEVYLVDLDAMVEGRRGLERDVLRFLANWDGLPEARERFRSALQAVGMPL